MRKIKLSQLGKVSLGILTVGILIGIIGNIPTNFRGVALDLLTAKTADVLRGEQRRFFPEYSMDDSIAQWGIESNSSWLEEYTRKIVPFMAQEGITAQGIYPQKVTFIPMRDSDSFDLGGMALCGEKTIVLNERYLIDDSMNDESRALAVLVHELIHIQGGVYCSGSSESMESATSAATVEVLAAMCNYGDATACSAFWQEVKSMSAGAGRYALLPQDWIYQLFMNLYVRTDEERYGSEKYTRDHPTLDKEILYKYRFLPWEKMVLKGVRDNLKLDSKNCGFIQSYYSFWSFCPKVEFNDTKALFSRRLLFFLLW